MADILSFESLPEGFADETDLEEFLSRPTAGLVKDFQTLEGDLIVLGVAGKVGPTLARMAKRANPGRRVIGVARFSDEAVKKRLESWDIETIACDLLDRDAVEALPKAPNVVYMAGKKFGVEDDTSFAWAMNAHVPGIVAEAFSDSRIVCFSTLCVYPFAPVAHGGHSEDVQPRPLGDYANSCVARERIFRHFSNLHGTPGRLIRLNYAIDMRYGVLYDIANWVKTGAPIPLATGHASVIWQGDSTAQILRSLLRTTTPTLPLNIGGPEHMSVRLAAVEFGKKFGREPVFEGEEAADAWVNSTLEAQRLFGYPTVPLAKMIDWVGDWVERDMPVHNKPTCYEVRDGRF